MPVHHQLQMRPDDYFGPIDGVRPIDYPVTYGALRDLRCVKVTRGDIYQKSITNRKVCRDCYLAIPADEQVEYNTVAVHCLVHWTSVYSQPNCNACARTIVIVEYAHHCGDCIEEYLDADLQLLRDGWGVPVVRRWQPQ